MTNLIAGSVARVTAPPEIVPPICPVCGALYGFRIPASNAVAWGLPLWRHPDNGCGMEDVSFCIPEQRSVSHD